jgi:hypothetical protein
MNIKETAKQTLITSANNEDVKFACKYITASKMYCLSAQLAVCFFFLAFQLQWKVFWVIAQAKFFFKTMDLQMIIISLQEQLSWMVDFHHWQLFFTRTVSYLQGFGDGLCVGILIAVVFYYYHKHQTSK